MPRTRNLSASEFDRLSRRVSRSETRSPLRNGAMEEGTLRIGPGARLEIEGEWTSPESHSAAYRTVTVRELLEAATLIVSGGASVGELSTAGGTRVADHVDTDSVYGRVLASLQVHPDGLQDGSGQPLYLAHGATVSPVSGFEATGSEVLQSNGQVTVTLPDHFTALIKPGTAVISVIGRGFTADWSSIFDGQFIIYGQASATATWRVFAERRDADFPAAGSKTDITEG